MKSIEIDFGQAASHSPWLVHDPKNSSMVSTMEEYFGSCTNHGECHEACPKEISIDFIALMNKDYLKAKIKDRKLISQQ